MAKYHINSKGNPALCRATKGKCPFGGADQHFGSRQEAFAEAERRHEQESVAENNVSTQTAQTKPARKTKRTLKRRKYAGRPPKFDLPDFSDGRIGGGWVNEAEFKVLSHRDNPHGFTEQLKRTEPDGTTSWFTREYYKTNSGDKIEEYYKDSDGNIHSDPDFPSAIVYQRGEDGRMYRKLEEYRHHGKVDRPGEPAVITYHPDGSVASETFWRDGKRHRDDGPAGADFDSHGNTLSESWWKDGKRHREDGPAKTRFWEGTNQPRVEDWMKNGQYHRDPEEGAAHIEYSRDGEVVSRQFFDYGWRVVK